MGRKEPNRKQAEETEQSRWGFRGMTVRNWLELLIVPLVLVGIGLLFEMQQANRQQAMEEQQQALEERRAEAERELAEQRAQDEALQAYLDQMSQLMLERKLLEAEQGDPVHTLARARTSTVILSLDAEHNASVIRFLSDSGLARSGGTSVSLLREIVLNRADLSGANLNELDLRNALLNVADLRDSFLVQADLRDALLIQADLRDAILRSADLSDALLDEADLSKADLGLALLPGASLHDADLSKAGLSSADLSDAVLLGANLSNANLIGVDLRNSDLRDADLRNANLGGAKLSGAEGISNEELEQQAASLEGATMPNGQKYEDWLESKDREANGKNDGSS